MQGSIALTVN